MTSIQWVGYPRAYTKGRTRPIQCIVLHYTAGSEGPDSAEAGARYDKTRPDGTSTHYFTDSFGPALQEVPDGDRAHTARQHGNDIGVQIEICGTAQTRAQWLDPVSAATLRTTAGLVAILLQRHNLPLRRMTTAEVRQAYYNPPGFRPKGICEHYDCTKAFPEDQGSHSDVGAGFPWDVFMSLVADAKSATTEGDEDMPKAFLFGGYWLAQGGKREVIQDADDMVKANLLYPGSCFPKADVAGFPTPDLKTLGWTEDEVNRLLGRPYEPARGSGEGGVSMTDVHAAIAGSTLVPPGN